MTNGFISSPSQFLGFGGQLVEDREVLGNQRSPPFLLPALPTTILPRHALETDAILETRR